MDLNELISLRIRLSDIIDELKKSYDSQRAPLDEKLEKLNQLILDEMHRNGVSSVNSPSGKAATVTLTKYKVENFEEFASFAIANQRLDLFKRDVVKSVADEFADIPGVKMDQIKSLRITRK